MSGDAASLRLDDQPEGSKAPIVQSLAAVRRYYTDKINANGATPAGVDWRDGESQELRFRQLLRLFEGESGPLTINDLGCGYGAFYDYLSQQKLDVAYCGADISPAMLARARDLHRNATNCRFVEAAENLPLADYTVASGVFNVKLECSVELWEDYMRRTIGTMNQVSRLGFAFNCLTSYSDAERMVDRLYYADPCRCFDHCKRTFSRHVALLHDYGLYEFTILVRKDR